MTRLLSIILSMVLMSALFALPATSAAGSRPTCRGQPATIVGTAGNDRIKGTGGRDVIVAGAGFDVIHARGGRDVICAGPDADVVAAGRGADREQARTSDDFDPDPDLELSTLPDTVARFETSQIELVSIIASSQEDWDRYESLHWQALEEWLHENPRHPAVPSFKELGRAERETYLRWHRDLLGWVISSVANGRAYRDRGASRSREARM